MLASIVFVILGWVVELMSGKIHYCVAVPGFDGWDGQTSCPPAVGDTIVIDGRAFVVEERTWRDAEATLGLDAARAWGHGAGDHVHVTLHCAVLGDDS